MHDDLKFKRGDKIFCWYNPGRYGYVTGITRQKVNVIYYQVDFQDSNTTEYVPEGDLKPVDHASSEKLIQEGRFGKVSDLRRNISHIQLGGKLSNLVYSLDITDSDFYPHQFKPVLAFLESPARGLLLADEVGLGKTIEAGLIWTELRARYDSRRMLVVCPAMLCEKWRDELRNRFGVDATIMDAAGLLDELQRREDGIQDGKGIICSIQSIRPPRGYEKEEDRHGARYELARYLDAQSDNPPIIDLVIIDEAHYLRNRETQSSRLGRMLRDISKDVLLLSATPINLKSEDLFSLLNIIDQDTFAVPDLFPQVLQANEPLVKARDLVLDSRVAAEEVREQLCKAARHELVHGNLQLESLIETLADPASVATPAGRVHLADRIDRVNLLRHVVNRTRKKDVIEMNVMRKPISQFVALDPDGVERKFYDGVTSAVRQYAEEHEINHGFLLANPQRQMSSCMYAAAKSWRDRAGLDNEILYRDMLYEDFGMEMDAVGNVAEGGKISSFLDHLAAKVLPGTDLQKLREHDSKFGKFHDAIRKHLEQYPNEKIIVFSYFRATLGYLKERLAEEGIVSQVLMGGMQESKQEIIGRFRDNDSIKVLLSSEVASEGVDLQFCRVVVNYDLPWNPMKIEQRIGRLDRIGQQSDTIDIWNLGHADTIDQRIYDRILVRLKIFERALGGMEAILGEKIAELTDKLMSRQLSPEEQERQIEQTANAIETTRQTEERLEKDAANLIAYGGYILERVKTAHKLKKRITENDLIVYVQDYLNVHVPGHKFQQPGADKNRVDITLPPKTAGELAEFVRTKKFGHTRLTSGMQVPCKFINKTKFVAGTTEQIDQFHPLVRFISAKVDATGFFPVVAVRLCRKDYAENKLPAGQYAFAIQKWNFNGLREEEDMRVQVLSMDSGGADIDDDLTDAEDSWKLINAVRLGGLDWPEARGDVSLELLEQKVFDCNLKLDRDFTLIRGNKDAENQDRVNLQIRSAKKHRDRQVAVQERVLENYRDRNQNHMIPATEGRIKKIKTRFDVQIEMLNRKAMIQSSKQHICCGALLIE